MDGDPVILLPAPGPASVRGIPTGHTRSSRAPAAPTKRGMETYVAPRSRPVHCPQCAATVRGDVPWCLACYTPFAADPTPDLAGPKPHAEPDAAPTAERDAQPNPGSGADPAGIPDVDALAEQLLAELAASRDRPTLGRLPATGAGRAAALAGLLTACSAVLLLAMSLVGLVL